MINDTDTAGAAVSFIRDPVCLRASGRCVQGACATACARLTEVAELGRLAPPTVTGQVAEKVPSEVVAALLNRMGDLFAKHYFKNELLALIFRAKLGDTTQTNMDNCVRAYTTFRRGPFTAGPAGDA